MSAIRTVRSLLAAIILPVCVTVVDAQQPASPGAASDSGAAVHGIDRADLDTTCAACKDFYQFATGGWQTRHPIPAAYPRWGSFDELQERNRDIVHQLLDDAARSTTPGRSQAAAGSGAERGGMKRVGLYYATCMDSAGANDTGLTPLKPELARIQAVTTVATLRRAAAHLQAMRGNVVFGVRSEQDAKNNAEQILGVSQGGLGLPDRDYYLKPDSASAAVRTAYLGHIARTLVLAGDDSTTAAGEADRVVALETALARAARPRAERRDPYSVYHRMSLAEAETLAPHVDWPLWLTEAGVPRVASLNVADPDFFRGLDTLLTTVPVADWRTYLRWHLLDAAAPWLDSAFVAENFRMQRTLTGTTEMLPRWKRCVQATDNAMGEALGEAYVARTFPPAAKARALAMVRNMEAVLREDLGTLAWMSPATRQAAIVKLDAFANHIGYPDRWRDYSALVIRQQPFIDNQIAAAEFEYRRRMAKIGRPVDRGEWTMTPPTVNAYYSPGLNEIVFPAGIMQPPFFDPSADDAVNYGGMGTVIGHEMTHGFDDQGRKYDAHGNLRDWWTAGDATGFQQRASGIVDQFNHYVAVDSVFVNGKLTQGENIADLGGLKIAYAALQRALKGREQPAIDGFTPDQRFFLSWARIWAQSTRPAFARQLAVTDPHSPGRWRVDGPLSNMPEFAAAFHCQAGDQMVRQADQRVSIW